MSKGLGFRSDNILAFPDYTQAVSLSTGSSNALALDIPTGMGFVGFSMNNDFWVKYGAATCTIPSTSSTAGTSTPELNPTYRRLGSSQSCTGIAIASEFATKGSVNWYRSA